LDSTGEPADLHRLVSEIIRLNLPNSALIDNSSNKFVVSKYADAFRNNISVITCNKIGNSESWEQYLEFRSIARKNNVLYHYETTVGAALPIIKSLNDLLISGDEIHRIEAILSGTISFIFNHYKEGRTFGDVVREAQAKGYTEPDPRDDLNGMDFSRKMLILAREMGLPMEMKDVVISPILPENCLNAASIQEFYNELDKSESYFAKARQDAANEGKVLRYIGKLERGQIHVSLQAVGVDHTFYSLGGSDNIIAFTTARYNQGPLVIKGPGAGPQVTAAGVFADIVKVASV
jgi:aspartokinase/homoserine dehydrogenase 1